MVIVLKCQISNMEVIMVLKSTTAGMKILYTRVETMGSNCRSILYPTKKRY